MSVQGSTPRLLLGINEVRPADNPSPFRFPLELERDIFEISARAHVGMAPRLVLIARRVLAWIEPIIYELVSLFDDTTILLFLRTLETKPAHFFANVKTLCLTTCVKHKQAARIVPACTGVVNLACWVVNGLPLPSITELTPQRLSLYVLGMDPDLPCCPEFTHRFYESVTHLEFTDSPWFWGTWTGFNFLPQLTHLAFHSTYVPMDFDNQLRSIVASCKKLKVCLILSYHGVTPLRGLQVVGDPRVVVLLRPDIRSNWEAFSFGKPDMWVEAEAVVSTQRETAKHCTTVDFISPSLS